MTSNFVAGSYAQYLPPAGPDISLIRNRKVDRAQKLGAVFVRPAPFAIEASGSFVFTHLPKTAGLTLRNILKCICAYAGLSFVEVFGGADLGPGGSIPNYRELAEERRQKARVVAGHLPFGLHQGHHLVLMRDPVERQLSMYAFMVERGTVKLGTPIGHLYRERMLRDNIQTRLLSGRLDLLEPGTSCSDEALGLALRNLTSYAVAADLVCFNDFLSVVLAVLRAPPMIYFRRNVTAIDLPRDLADEIRADVRSRGSYDVALFEAIRGRARTVLRAAPATATPAQGCLAFQDASGGPAVYAEDGEAYMRTLNASGVPLYVHEWGKPLRKAA